MTWVENLGKDPQGRVRAYCHSGTAEGLCLFGEVWTEPHEHLIARDAPEQGRQPITVRHVRAVQR